MSKNKRQATTYTKRRNLGITTFLENSNATPFRWSTGSGHYQCFCCFKPFLDMQLLREHFHTKHSGKQMRLTLVREPRGKLVKVDIKALVCFLCDLPLRDVASLKSHLTVEHSKSCEFGKNELLVPFVLEENAFACQLCSEVFNGFHSLNQHMNVHFRNHVCDLCGRGFISFERLTRHIAVHNSSSATFQCEPCTLTFASKYKLEVHKLEFHNMKYRHKCPRCPERFKDHYLRTNHLTAVHGLPPIEHRCGMCDKAFARKGPLNAHIRQVHLKVRNHQCQVCGHKFYQKSHLSKHMVSHSGEKNFHCEICGKSYTLKNNLTHHLRTHHGEKKTCSLCERVFPDSDRFLEHMRSHVAVTHFNVEN